MNSALQRMITRLENAERARRRAARWMYAAMVLFFLAAALNTLEIFTK